MRSHNVYTNQSLIVPLDRRTEVTILGVGHLGSMIAFGIGQMSGVPIVVYDDDVVEETNLPASFYTHDQVDWHKVDALKRNLKVFSDTHVTPVATRYTTQEISTPVCVFAFDTVEARRMAWNNITRTKRRYGPKFFIDARSAGGVVEVYAFDKSMDERYRASLEGTPSALPCGGKSYIATSLVAAGVSVSFLAAWWREGIDGVPFKYRLDMTHPEAWTSQIWE